MTTPPANPLLPKQSGNSTLMKSALVGVVAVVFLAAFVAVWGWIALELWQFEPNGDVARLDLDAKVVEVAGFLAATVGAGTAAFLGIEVQKRGDSLTLRTWFKEQKWRARFLAAGVLAYVVIGTIVAGFWLTTPEPTPDFVATFAWGVLGWAAGAFSAVFAAKET